MDRAPVVPPEPHESGRKYKYRQRYAIKTRSRKVVHEPPDVLNQFIWKPYVSKPKSPRESAPPKRKVYTRNVLSKLDAMEKKGLVEELEWQHPNRILNVGTVNANISRALAKDPLLFDDHVLRVKYCLSTVAQLASETKRICQLAIGQYLEALSLENLDDMDRLILSRLCYPFTNNDVLTDEVVYSGNSEEQEETMEQEEIDEIAEAGH